MVHSNLVKQIDYLKVENQILRSKLGQKVNLTNAERQRLIKYSLPLGGGIRSLLSIVSYSTFRRWFNNGVSGNKVSARGRRKLLKR